MKIEHQQFPFEIKEIKLSDKENRVTFRGYASTFGNKDLGGDVVAAGAFTKAVKSGKPIMLLADHAATVKNNIGFGFDLKEDSKGLTMTSELNLDKEAGRETYAMLKHAAERGYKSGLSIGYSVNDYEWDEKNRVRTIKSADLWEVSNVIFPMNPKATVTAVKSLLESGTNEEIAILKRDIGTHLRDACGFSKSAAEAFVAVGWNALGDQEEQGAIEAINQITQNLKS